MEGKKIYIAGCGGMLGDAFYKCLIKKNDLKCTDIDLNEDWLEYLDIRNLNSYEESVQRFNPDYLFHLGALTSLEECEENKDNAYLTNTISVENATFIANKLNIPLLYISTAGIFDGKKDIYDDWDKPNPLGHYARSKYLGEQFVQRHAKKYVICRAGWMMGGGLKKDKKFIKKILTQINEGNKELFIVNDKMGTPTYTYDFAKNVELILDKQLYGLYNLVCEGLTSRIEVTRHILKKLNLSSEISLTEVNSDYFKKTYYAPRPYSERLINKKLKLRNINIIRHWETCLDEYLLSMKF